MPPRMSNIWNVSFHKIPCILTWHNHRSGQKNAPRTSGRIPHIEPVHARTPHSLRTAGSRRVGPGVVSRDPAHAAEYFVTQSKDKSSEANYNALKIL
jgi:hypothetical protein